jgi:hypothetical protein
MAEMDEVTTTRRTLPASLAARSTFRVPSTAGTISWLCDRERSRVSLSSRWGVNGTLRRIGTHLGVVDGVDGAGGGEVEDAGAAPRGVDERRAVEEVAAEDAEAALAGERVEVVRLRPVICTSPPGGQIIHAFRVVATSTSKARKQPPGLCAPAASFGKGEPETES